MAVLDPGPLSPPWAGAYKYGVLSYALSKRRIDSHAWSAPENNGGAEIGPNLICTPAATEYDNSCSFPNPIKSNPIIATRGEFTAVPRWFEVALQESTRTCPDLEPLAKQSLLATIEHAVEQETLDLLLAGPVVLGSEPSYLCALSAAVQAAGGVTNSDGRALIFIPPTLAVYGLGTGYLKDDGAGHLVDPFGNWFVVLKGPNATRIFVANEAYLELWLSDVNLDSVSYPRDSQRDTNTLVVRAEQAYIYVQNYDCEVLAIDFVCGV